jgi:hypothetical protein
MQKPGDESKAWLRIELQLAGVRRHAGIATLMASF